MIPTKRILTRKSLLKFGKWKDYTVQELLNLGKKEQLISAYFKLTSIDFKENILIELGITESFRIEKPNSNKELFYEFLNANGYKPKVRNREGADGMRKESKILSKSALQRINQNK